MRAVRHIVFATVALALMRTPARAQCGESPSSCATCHDHVSTDGAPWHYDHAFADLCSRCHAGDPLGTTITAAHEGLVDPLANPSATCATCHADDATALAQRYREASIPPAPATTVEEPASGPPNDPAAALAIVAIAFVGAGWMMVGTRRHHATLRSLFTRPSWSPYAAGALLGVVVAISLVVFGRRLSGAGAYQSLSGYVGAPLAPSDPYWTSIVRTGMTWDVWLLVGTFAGAFLSALTSRQLRLRTMPEARWIEAFGPRVALRWALVFVGTAVLSIAAGIAGGCTASLVLSGGAVLAPGAFVFMAAMFAGGVPVAWPAARRAHRRHP